MPETPPQNEMTERTNWIIEKTRCLLLEAKLCKTFWLRTFADACFLRNRVSLDKVSKSPLEIFIGKRRRLEKLKKSARTVFVQRRKKSRS